jgi:hypothetical protein
MAGMALIDSASIRAAVPTAPANLTSLVNGQTVTLTWTAAANSPTNYVVQAGFASGQTAATFNVGTSTSITASAGAGTYYVRIVAMNAEGISPPSNEVVVVIGCASGVPQNFRVMQKGAEAFLFWMPPSTGGATGYGIQAGLGPNQTIAFFTTPNTSLNATAGSGTYFVRVLATTGCGNGPATPDVEVSFPNNSVRVPDPDPGTFLACPMSHRWSRDSRQAIVRPVRTHAPRTGNTIPARGRTGWLRSSGRMTPGLATTRNRHERRPTTTGSP